MEDRKRRYSESSPSLREEESDDDDGDVDVSRYDLTLQDEEDGSAAVAPTSLATGGTASSTVPAPNRAAGSVHADVTSASRATVASASAATGGDSGAFTARPPAQKPKLSQLSGRECPYMDTIDRNVLDFDRARECSVTGAVQNIYGCLVCGKYFQGRGMQTQAYLHSVSVDHHLFINLDTEKVYCLPDGYEVQDRTLDDIRQVLDPKFTETDVARFDTTILRGRSLDGKEVIAGCLGLTSLASVADPFNAVVQVLAHVPPIRDFFALRSNYKVGRDSLVDMFAITLRKLWNWQAFRHYVSPHALLQACMLHAERHFDKASRTDAMDLMLWLLHALHLGLLGESGMEKKGAKRNSVIFDTFQGEVEVTTAKDVLVTDGVSESDPPKFKTVSSTRTTPFLYLALDLPSAPLFKDAFERTIIPQIPLDKLLDRFDGETIQYVRAERRTQRLLRLPRYLIISYKRFSKNLFTVEKNPTSVAYPMTGLDLSRLFKGTLPPGRTAVYDLVANITHESPQSGRLADEEARGAKLDAAASAAAIAAAAAAAAKVAQPTAVRAVDKAQGRFRCYVLHRAVGKWLEMNDVDVQERLPQLMQLGDTYIQVWEQRQADAMRE